MSEPLELGLTQDPGGPPPPIDPELLRPVLPGDEFFKTLPERPRVRPGPFTVALLVHAVVFALMVWYDVTSGGRLAQRVAELSRAGVKRGGDERIPVMIVPNLPSALRPRGARPPPPPEPAQPPVQTPPGTPPPAPVAPAREPRYTHIIQPEHPDGQARKGALFSDRDRRGAAPTTSDKPDPNNPDPTSLGRDGRRSAISAPGPDRPGEPGSEKPVPRDTPGGGAGGVNGRDGEQGSALPRGGKPAFGRSGTVYGGTPPRANPGGATPMGPPGSTPRGVKDPLAPGGPALPAAPPADTAGSTSGGRKPGAPGRPGAPGEGAGSAPLSIREQLADMARSSRSDTFHNPRGGPFQLGAFSFDTQGYDLGDYDRKMHQAVEREWNPPSVPIQNNIRGCTLLSFSIERDGRVSSVEMLRTSGTESYDRAAVSALRNAHLPPLPEKMPLERLTGSSMFIINMAEPLNRNGCGAAVAGAPAEAFEP